VDNVPQPQEKGLIPCGNDVNGDGIVRDIDTDKNGKIDEAEVEECHFWHLALIAKNIINFLIYAIAAPIAAVMFLYAGFLMLTNAGNEEKITRAKHIFGTVFVGIVIALAAWLIITFILDFFVGGTAGDEFRLFI
jgi:hypothetical protein